MGETKKKSLRARYDEQGGWGMSHAVFHQKLLNTQHSMGRCTRKSPMMKWANALKKSSIKIFTEAKAASHNTASWYTDTQMDS